MNAIKTLLSITNNFTRHPGGYKPSLNVLAIQKSLEEQSTKSKGVMRRSKFGAGMNPFEIVHFAGPVTYNYDDGFIERNTEFDLRQESFVQLLRSGTWLLGQLLPTPAEHSRIQTTAEVFHTRVDRLVDEIEATGQHHIRCIKPNNKGVPYVFDSLLVNVQLEACGIEDIVRLSKVIGVHFPRSQWLMR